MTTRKPAEETQRVPGEQFGWLIPSHSQRPGTLAELKQAINSRLHWYLEAIYGNITYQID